MKGNKKTLFVLALLLLVGITSGYIANTYAKYASAIPTKTATATVAKWNFVEDNGTQTVAINLANTPDPSTLIGERIAPGTSGSFNIELKNTSDTGVDYTIKLTKPENAPKNLKFYTDAEHTNALISETPTPNTATTGTITGSLAAKQPATEGAISNTPSKSVTIYWAWEFGNSDEVTDATNAADTTDGQAGNNLTISVDITGVQSKLFKEDGNKNIIE